MNEAANLIVFPSVIIKRDGREKTFDPSKINQAIKKAFRAVGSNVENREISSITSQVLTRVYQDFNLTGVYPTVEGVQDIVEEVLMVLGYTKVAKAYILYRDERSRVRQGKSNLMNSIEEIIKEPSRENANIGFSASAKIMQVAGEAFKEYYLINMDKEFSMAHRNGDFHIHDLDFLRTTINCVQLPLGKLLSKGFNNGHGFIRPPRRPSSAAALAAIAMQSSQNDMYGGQSYPFFDRDMAPYIENANDNEAYQAMEAIVYNLNSMHSRAGAQVPFSTFNIGTDISKGGRNVIKNILLAFEAGLGNGETPVFPNIVFRLKSGVNLNPGDPNYDMFKLALRVASKRMNPTFSFMDSPFNKHYGDQVSYMGCRSRVIGNCNGPEVTEGRGNIGAVTLNLPRIALMAGGDKDKFFSILRNRIDLCVEQLHSRYTGLCYLKGKDIPFLIGENLYVGSEEVGPNDSIEPCLKHGTLAIGFIGLAETLISLTGKHHGESENSLELGYNIIKTIRNSTDEATMKYSLNYVVLATPAEGLSGRFIALDKKIFGYVEGVTEKDFYTNSFHVPVWYSTSLVNKFQTEAPFHMLTNAGHISYGETESPPINNLEFMEDVLRYAGNLGMGYVGFNFPKDECEGRIEGKERVLGCGYSGVIKEDICPNCGGSIKRLRRITGYLAESRRWGDGKLAELRSRVIHF